MGTSYMIEDQIPEIKRSPWVDNFFRPLLITTMLMCFNYSLVNFVRLLNPAWRGYYFLAGMLLTTVEAIYSYRVLRHWRSRGISLLRYRLAEAIVLIILLKLLSFGGKPIPEIVAEIQGLWHNPLTFLTIEYYILLTLALLTWVGANHTVADFEALYDPYTFRTDHIMPLNDLANRFFWGGIALVAVSGFTHWVVRAGVSSLTNFQRPSLSGIIINVLLYFVLGLVLLSQANLTRLMIRWRVQKVEVAPDLVKQWGLYALIFLSGVAALIFFLPTGYTLGFLASAAIVVQFLLKIVIFLAQLIIFLLSLPLAWLLSVLDQTPLEQNLGSAPPIFPQLPPSAEAGANPWFEIIRSLTFWLVALAILGYFIKIYLADHPEIMQTLRRFRLVALLLKGWQQLWHFLTGLARAGRTLLPQIKPAFPPQANEGRDQDRAWFRRLSPRERVMYYYRNVLDRAREKGPGRRPGQTPYEYQPTLEHLAADAQPEVQQLTEAYVQARYGSGQIDKRDLKMVKSWWQGIKRALRQLRRDE